jgi:hypothetical protein
MTCYEDIPRWSGIDTAPRDGRQVYLFSEGDIVLGRFQGDRWVSSLPSPIPSPSHWYPLPEPPDMDSNSDRILFNGQSPIS